MSTIRSLFAKPIERKIEEVIKVDQFEDSSVKTEFEEYIVTESIKEHYQKVYDEIIDVARNPREGIGLWVSGFFGSGKSSFAKILGYTVSDRIVGSEKAGALFKRILKDTKTSSLLDVINTTIPLHAVIFDVSHDRGIRIGGDRITAILYHALLRELDYAEDFDLAELEITLEGDGKLDEFMHLFSELHDGKDWKTRRKLGFALNEASAVLHRMDPKTYPYADSYGKSLSQGRADITPNILAERAFLLAGRRIPGKAVIFIIDEVGQFVSRSVDKMLDLQGVVEAFGREGKNRIIQKKAVAPFWIVVTSQEKLNEIVDALDSNKIELARLQDRFRVTVDLKQTDIATITGKRVLDKSEEARAALEKLYRDNEGRLKSLCVLEHTSRDVSISMDDFVNLYPYLPYQIDLCIDIVAGLRLKRSVHRHIGGSNRTIIKQAQEMMINPRTMVAELPVGSLVTLDKVYELLYMGNLLPSEVSKEIDNIPKNLKGNDLALKVAKAIALFEVVKDLPRTPHNIAVVLHPSVVADSLVKEVEEALKALMDAQIVRETDEGYKLLTVQEKKWDIDRKAILPKPADRNKILRELMKEIFSEPGVKMHRYGIRSQFKQFRLALSIEDEAVDSDGQIVLNLNKAEELDEMPGLTGELREKSNREQNMLFWGLAFNDEIHTLFNELYRSREMVTIHERLASQGKLTPEESSCLSEEKVRRDRTQRNLKTKLLEVLLSGKGFFRGIQYDGSLLGQTLGEILSGLLDKAIPELYPKLDIGMISIPPEETVKFLSAANLNGLPSGFYEGDQAKTLVLSAQGKYVPNLAAEICREVLDYLTREHKYGTKVTGKMLESHFQGLGFGWDVETVQLVLAVLFRGGAIEVTHQGRKYGNYSDPACHSPFSKIPAFRAASFSPREPIDLRTLTGAARHYEEITGKEVDIEEGAIADAFRKLAMQDREALVPLVERMKVAQLPGKDFAESHLETVEGIIDMPSDDCVKTLAGEGQSYREARNKAHRLIEASTDDTIALMKRARHASSSLWPILKERGPDASFESSATRLPKLIADENFYDSLIEIRDIAKLITDHYENLYCRTHTERTELYVNALDEVKGLPEWAVIAADNSMSDMEKSRLTGALARKADDPFEFSEDISLCRWCSSSLSQLENDIEVIEAVKEYVIREIIKASSPDEAVERVKVSSLFSGAIVSEEDVEKALEQLKEHLLKLIGSGIKIILE